MEGRVCISYFSWLIEARGLSSRSIRNDTGQMVHGPPPPDKKLPVRICFQSRKGKFVCSFNFNMPTPGQYFSKACGDRSKVIHRVIFSCADPPFGLLIFLWSALGKQESLRRILVCGKSHGLKDNSRSRCTALYWVDATENLKINLVVLFIIIKPMKMIIRLRGQI